jgi:hypothetical protein
MIHEELRGLGKEMDKLLAGDDVSAGARHVLYQIKRVLIAKADQVRDMERGCCIAPGGEA